MISPELLYRFPHFAKFSPESLRMSVMGSQRRSFEAGEWIFMEGNQAREFCILLTGEIQVAFRVGSGDVAVSDTITSGEAVTWSSMLAPYVLTANCIGQRAGEYFAVDAEQIREVFLRIRKGGTYLMQQVAQTMRDRLIGLRV